jgi:predicted CoA-substrate-specific enzyme activase
MITVGIDAGLESVKVVILKDGRIVGKSKGPSGGAGRPAAIDALLNEAIAEAGIAREDIENTVSTGAGKFDAACSGGAVTEPIADARAARYRFADATSVVDIGADQTRVVTLGEGDKIEEIVLNQKCGAGIGRFFKIMAYRLEMTPEDIGDLPPDTARDAAVNDGCVVFAELDALELLNRGVAKEKVAGAAVEAAATRICMALNDKIVPAKETTVLFGGVSQYGSLVNALERRSGIKFIVPEDAEFGGALGCALIAAGRN